MLYYYLINNVNATLCILNLFSEVVITTLKPDTAAILAAGFLKCFTDNQ